MTSAYLPPAAWRILNIAGAAAVTAACNLDSSLDVDTVRNYGFVTIAAGTRASGEYRTQPTAEFFRGTLTSVPNSAIRSDTCAASATFQDPPPPLTGVSDLTAGAAISLAFGSRTESLVPGAFQGRTRYALAAGASAAHTPGDSVTVTIPGGAFPATTMRAKTAEPFTISAITPPAAGQNIQLQWTPAVDANSGMIISLRYAAAGSGSTLNREIRCFFDDDGADSVPTRYAQLWGSPTVTVREAVATRIRTRLIPVVGGLAEVISLFTVPTPTVP